MRMERLLAWGRSAMTCKKGCSTNERDRRLFWRNRAENRQTVDPPAEHCKVAYGTLSPQHHVWSTGNAQNDRAGSRSGLAN